MENQNTNIKEFTFLGRSMESVSIIYGIFLIICSIVLTLFWDFYANPLDSIVYNPNASGH